jgi:hypothetical protein
MTPCYGAPCPLVFGLSSGKGYGENQYTRTALDFGSYSRRIKVSISGYMTFDATKNMGQKTNKMGIFVFPASLNTGDHLYRTNR